MNVPTIRQQSISLLKATHLLAEELEINVPSAAAILAGAILDGHLKANFHHKETFPFRVGAGYFVDLENATIIPVGESPYALASLRAAVNRDPINETAWSRIDIEQDNLKSCCEYRGWRLPSFWFQERAVEKASMQPVEKDGPALKVTRRRREDDITFEIDRILEELGDGVPAAVVFEMLSARAGTKGCCIKEAGPDYLIWSNGTGRGTLTMEALKKRLYRRRKEREELLSVNQVK